MCLTLGRPGRRRWPASPQAVRRYDSCSSRTSKGTFLPPPAPPRHATSSNYGGRKRIQGCKLMPRCGEINELYFPLLLLLVFFSLFCFISLSFQRASFRSGPRSARGGPRPFASLPLQPAGPAGPAGPSSFIFGPVLEPSIPAVIGVRPGLAQARAALAGGMSIP